MRFQVTLLFVMVLAGLSAPCFLLAGAVDPPAAPTDVASAMFTVDDLYNRLFNGTAGTKRMGAFTEPGAIPAPTGHTLDQVMALAPAVDDVNGSAPADVVTAKKYWDIRSGSWGLGTGSLTAQTITATATSFAAGYFPATDLRTVDSDLVSTNILFGATIFGIAGHTNVRNTSSGDAVAGDIASGKKGYVDGALVTGTVASGGDISSGTLTTAIPTGIYSSKTYTVADGNLVNTNIRTGITIFGVTGNVVAAAGTAVVANVYTGKTFSTGAGALTGTMAAIGASTYTPSTSNQAISAGYHGGAGSVSGDASLVAGNIRGGSAGSAGVSIFGVAGSTSVANTGTATATSSDLRLGKTAYVSGAAVTGAYVPGSAPARVAKTGQTTTYTAGDDGHLGVGAGKVTPRFTDNANGTITDNLTGLIWLKDANCTAFYAGDATDTNFRNWTNALTAANSLTSVGGYCGLSDGSTAGQWRLPSYQELASLADYAFIDPVVPNTAGTGPWTAGDPFTSVQRVYYWSSTTSADDPTEAWRVYLIDGAVNSIIKGWTCYVWPVRGGQ